MSVTRKVLGFLTVGSISCLGAHGCGATSPLYDGPGPAGTTSTGGDETGGDGTGPASSGGSGGGGRATGGVSSGGAVGGAATGGRKNPSGGTSGRSGSGGSETGGRPTRPDECPGSVVQGSAPHFLTANTDEREDSYTPGCGAQDGSGDMSWFWEVPRTGRYSFDTLGSTFDTVLAIYEGLCTNTSITCNDDFAGPDLRSSVTLDLVEGQEITIVVDGYWGAEGLANVQISLQGDCPDESTSWVPYSTSGTTVRALDRFDDASCGAMGSSGDYVVGFTAPYSGGYVVDTVDSSFDTVLAVYDRVCGGTELACDDDSYGSSSQVTVYLAEGQQVSLVVDGFGGGEGEFALNVQSLAVGSCCEASVDIRGGCTPFETAQCVCETLPECCKDGWTEDCVSGVQALGCGTCGPCPEERLAGDVPQTIAGSTIGRSSQFVSTCGGSPSGDYTFGFTAPYTGTFLFDTLGSTFDTILAVYDGGCDGPELVCNDDASGFTSRVAVELVEGQAVVLVVDGYSAAQGDFVLNVRDAPASLLSCCTGTSGRPGCEDEDISACVCRQLPACCESSWTDDCVTAVETYRCGACAPYPL